MELTQSLILSIIASAIEQRSILVTSNTRLDRTITVLQDAVSNLFSCSKPILVRCEKLTSWQSLDNDIKHASRVSEFVLVANPAALDISTQAHLTEILQSGQFRIIFIGSSKGMSRILCKQIFFQITFPADEDQIVSGQEHVGIKGRLDELRTKAEHVFISNQVGQYAQDIVVFTRTHRFVKRGVPPAAVEYLTKLIRILTVFAGLDYAVPQTVNGAARLVLPLHIDLCEPGDDISLEYGGDLDIITGWLKNWDPVLLVDNVIDLVPAPL